MIRALHPRPPRRRAGRGARRGAGARSTSTAPCAPCCARWASPAGSAPAARHDRSPDRAARRRLRLDASLCRRPAPAGAPGRARRAPGTGRGVHAGHAADPDHAAAAHLRSRAGPGPRRRAGAGLVGRHPPRRDAQGVPRPLGRQGCGPRRRRGGLQRRLGARRRRRAGRADAAAAGARPSRGVGEPAPRQGGLPAGAATGSRRPCRTATTSWPATPWRLSTRCWR